MRNVLALALMFLSMPLISVFSEEKSDPDEIRLDEIVVTATRTEESYGDLTRKVDLLTSKNLESTNPLDFAEALKNLPSLNIIDYGGVGGNKNLRMRGSSAQQVLVLVDGRPLNNPRDGIADLRQIGIDHIDRIELMYGPGSTQYGSSAMGGTLNVITKKTPKQGSETELGASIGSFDTYEATLSHSARITPKFGVTLSGEYESSEGFRENSQSKDTYWNGTVSYDLSDKNSFAFSSDYSRTRTGTPGPLTYLDNDDLEKERTLTHCLTWFFNPDESDKFTTKIYRFEDRLEFFENSAGSLFDIENAYSRHKTVQEDADIQWEKKWTEKYQWVLGTSTVGNQNDSTDSSDHRYEVNSAFLENRYDFTEKFRGNLGLRVDDYSNVGSQFSPDISFLYKMSDDLHFHGLAAKSFRAPTFNDLYWPDQGWSRGNPDLKPEKSTTWEAGFLKYLNKNVSTDLTFYENKNRDLINWLERAGVWQPENIDSARTRGVELENKYKASAHLLFTLDYTYTSAKDRATGNDLIYQPRHSGIASVAYTAPYEIETSLSVQYRGKCYHDPDNQIPVPGYSVFGAKISKKWRSGIVSYLSLDNLFDKDYQTIRDYPMPGFAVTLGVKEKF